MLCTNPDKINLSIGLICFQVYRYLNYTRVPKLTFGKGFIVASQESDFLPEPFLPASQSSNLVQDFDSLFNVYFMVMAITSLILYQCVVLKVGYLIIVYMVLFWV